ncbi:MAG: ribosome-associated translation inhibitor RaiA [Lentisphaeria bacterium]|jgi:putative sigma-54 modulation protein
MEVIVSGRRQPATDALKLYSEERLAKIDGKYHKLNHAHVILDREHDFGVAEVTITGAHVSVIGHGRAEGNNLFAAIDDAVAKVEAQLHRHVEKLRDTHTHVDKEKLHEAEQLPAIG